MGADLANARVLVATVLVDLGLAGIVGAWACALGLRRAASAWGWSARRRAWAALRVALVVTATSDAALFWLQVAAMGDLPLADALTMLPAAASQTHVGRAWAGGALGLAVVLAATRGSRLGRLGLRLAVVAVGAGLFVCSRAAVSHAGGFGLASAQLVVECVHLVAISLWLGLVGMAAFVVPAGPVDSAPAETADVAAWVRSLSSAATGALAAIVATGLVSAWRAVGSTANLVGSGCGRMLLLKVAFVAVAVALGGFNRFRVMPRLLAALPAPVAGPAPPQRRFVQILRIEAVLLLAALVAAAFLGSSPSPVAM